ncbi:hypothetical protein SAY86_024201 [Trapa natans]|uniref:Uncharacterized protein n=1 Tax=Trapa natans TaxID=22666 RepID=A0AAN7LVP1_TRANT|nr:hypothetical protein SAY86_024201 [Trapa natans]
MFFSSIIIFCESRSKLLRVIGNLRLSGISSVVTMKAIAESSLLQDGIYLMDDMCHGRICCLFVELCSLRLGKKNEVMICFEETKMEDGHEDEYLRNEADLLFGLLS